MFQRDVFVTALKYNFLTKKSRIVDFLNMKSILFPNAISILAEDTMEQPTTYTEDNIRSLDWKEHIRMRPGMYIGKLGDGSSPDDGIYILLKEVLTTVSMNM